MRTAVIPAVLLPDTDDINTCGPNGSRVDGDVGLFLSIHVVGARLASVQTTGVGTCAGDFYNGECLYLANGGSGQDSQQCYYAYKYILKLLQVTHRILLLGNVALQIRRDPNGTMSHTIYGSYRSRA